MKAASPLQHPRPLRGLRFVQVRALLAEVVEFGQVVEHDVGIVRMALEEVRKCGLRTRRGTPGHPDGQPMESMP